MKLGIIRVYLNGMSVLFNCGLVNTFGKIRVAEICYRGLQIRVN
jgi:hypothetical protein